MSQVKIREIVLDLEKQETCIHEWSTGMIYLFSGMIGQICSKCHKSGPQRPMTKEESDGIDWKNL